MASRRTIPRVMPFVYSLQGFGVVDVVREPGAYILRANGWRMKVEGAKAIGHNWSATQVLDHMAERGHRPVMIRPIHREVERALVTLKWEHFAPLLAIEEGTTR